MVVVVVIMVTDDGDRIPFKEKLIIVENTGAHTPATLSSIFKGPPEAYLIELHTEIRVPSHKIIPH